MASLDRILEDINDIIDIEVNLFNIQANRILKEVEEQVALKAVAFKGDSLSFEYEVQKILTESGYYDLVSDFIDDSYDKTYGEIISLFEAGGLAVTFTDSDIQAIKAIKQLDLDFFNDIGKQASMTLKRDLYKYSLSDMNVKDIATNIRESLKGTPLAKYSSTYADTMISNFNQSVIDMKAQDVVDEVYIYRGVKDSHTRKFCACLVGQKKYYDKSDAGKIKSDKRREFNCRHLIVPVGKEFAEDSGFVSGGFSC